MPDLVLYTGSWKDVTNKFQNRVTSSLWNKELWLDVASQETIFNQSECIVSELSICVTLKFVCDNNYAKILYKIASSELNSFVCLSRFK